MSGFDDEPQFEIISMPDENEEATEAEEDQKEDSDKAE